MTDPREAQLLYELNSDSEAQAKRLAELIKASREGDVELPRANALIGRMCDVVQQHLQTACDTKTRGIGGKYKRWLRELPLDVASVIAIRECIRLCTSPETRVHVQDLTFNVGKLWELEVRIRQAEKVNPVYMQKIHDQVKDNCTRDYTHLRRLYNVAVERVFKGTIDLSLTKTEMMQIGKFGVDACYEAGLIEQVRGVNRNGTTVAYVLNEEVADFLGSYTDNDVRFIISKEDTRMVCPPDPWTNLSDGGYLSVRRKTVAPLLNIRKMRKSVRQQVADAFTAEKMPEVFSAGNYLQEIPFRLHAPTRDAIVRVWDAGGAVLGVPSKSAPPKPAFPFAKEWASADAPPEELAVFNAWKREAALYFDDLREWRGKVREVGGFLRSVREIDQPYWFPVYCDSRGRWYYRGVPNPQGSDLAKAVIHFDQKKPLGARGLFWLKVHIANSFGFDKARMRERAEWTDRNWPSIVRAIDAPEDYPEVWGTDAPWCMYAAAVELRNALQSGCPERYCTGIPIHMDATCSGLQHFSALLRDPAGGMYVNLTDPDKVGPKKDIYTRVADNVIRLLEMDARSQDQEVAAMAQFFLCTGVPRDLAKKPVMTYVYGATLRGVTEHIEQKMLREILPSKGMEFPDMTARYAYCMYLAKKMFASIAAAVPAAAAAMHWLREIARQKPSGERMMWKTPTGFLVQHDYQDYTDVKVRLNSCGVTWAWVRDWNDGTRPLAMQNAISPNFVHALDASHLTMVVNAMKADGLDIVTIHDSFGTHPADVDTMHRHIREQFVALYSRPNLLAEFLWDVGGVGEPPERGSLDLREVLDSEFMFS